MNQRTEKFTLKAIQQYHHTSLVRFDDQETLVEALANRIGFVGANPVAFLSILARRPEIRLNDLDEAILTDKTLVRANVFRNSLFLIASVDYPVYFRALSQLLKNSNQLKMHTAGLTEHDLMRMQHRLEEANSQFSQTHEQIIEVLYTKNALLPAAEVQKLIIRKLCEIGMLVRTHHKGWKGNDFLYALTKNWFPDFRLTAENQEGARTQMVRRYIAAYGPVSREDIIWWTGLNENQIQRTLSNLRRELTLISLESHRDDLLMLKEKLHLVKQSPALEHHIVFLPPWDPFTCGWLNRKRTTKKSDFGFVYDSVGNATGTIVQLGRVIGIWQFRDSQSHIFEYHLFEAYQDLAHDVQFLAEQYAELLTKISGAGSANIYERPLLEPLGKRTPGSFLWPLGKELPFKSTDPNLMRSPLARRASNTFRKPYLDGDNLVRP